MPKRPESTPLRRPRQSRSRDTLERLTKATRELLEDSTFEEIGVTDIARRARSSVGAFYSRFEDKDGLLHYLDQLYQEELRTVYVAVEASAQTLESTVAALVPALVRLYRERRGLLRTLVRRSSVPGGVAREPQRFAKLILAHRSEIPHPNPDVAVTLGLVMLFGAIRARVLGDGGDRPAITDTVLASELCDALLAYLRGGA